MNPFVDGRPYRMGLDLLVKGFTPAGLETSYNRMFLDSEKGRLLLETATLEEIDDEYNDGDVWDEDGDDIFEAVIVRRYSQTDARMRALSKVFSKYLGNDIQPLDPVIGRPKKSGLFATVTAQIPFTDGQVISIVFHSPDGDAKQIGPEDSLIAFRWILNKRDITHVVSPEGEADVSLEEVGKRIAQLVTKNSAKFQATQKEIQEQKQQLEELKAALKNAEDENVAMIDELHTVQAKQTAIENQIAMTTDLLSKQQEKNADLENKLASLKAQEEALRAQKEEEAKRAAEEDEKVRIEAKKKAQLDELAKEAASLGVSQDIIDGLIKTGSVEGLQMQIDQKKREAAADETRRMIEIGQREVPGIRMEAAEEAGRLWTAYQNGNMSTGEWEQIKQDYYTSGKAIKPSEPNKPIEPEQPAAVTVANDILAGKYDDLPLKEIMQLSEPIWDLDESVYSDLMTQVDAYLTKLTRERAMAA